jgi:hypothetical protein
MSTNTRIEIVMSSFPALVNAMCHLTGVEGGC